MSRRASANRPGDLGRSRSGFGWMPNRWRSWMTCGLAIGAFSVGISAVSAQMPNPPAGGPIVPNPINFPNSTPHDEEKSRAKERIFSFRDTRHRWDPKSQRPELWNLYNARKNKGESIRVFPLSNWTELDIWQYIHRENIPIVPLYFAAERPVVWRDGQMIMVDDDRMRLNPGEKPEMRNIRFRTLGCYPLTGAIESNATSLLDIVEEMLVATSSERQGRVIDKDQAASMEKKKQEGYF